LKENWDLGSLHFVAQSGFKMIFAKISNVGITFCSCQILHHWRAFENAKSFCSS
jgi:hypothetical protein